MTIAFLKHEVDNPNHLLHQRLGAFGEGRLTRKSGYSYPTGLRRSLELFWSTVLMK